MPVFLRIEWLFCFIPLVMVMVWIYYQQSKAHNWENVCDKHLLSHLIVSIGQANKLPFIILGLFWSLSILALSGPSWTKVQSPVFKSNATTIVLLDLSYEMLVQDPAPNRLARAKYKISDLLKKQADRRFGLAVFSQEAFTVSPVTKDSATVDSLVAGLSPDIMPVIGKNISHGLNYAKELLIQSGQPKGNILLITTGGASDSDIQEAAKIHSRGIDISVLAIGSSTGGPIPSEHGFVKNEQDKVHLSKLDQKSLSKLANVGGGVYKELSHNDVDIDNLTSHWMTDVKKEQDQLTVERYKDDGYWLLWLLVPLAAFGFRRGWRESVL